jgi:competence protein ComEC
MGDAEKESEEDMIKAGNDLKADVLKVGHHGSSSGTSTMFLDLVKPNYAVIMAGEGNPYGHPHREILSRLASGNTEILRTDINGTICISTDGNTLQISTEK